MRIINSPKSDGSVPFVVLSENKKDLVAIYPQDIDSVVAFDKGAKIYFKEINGRKRELITLDTADMVEIKRLSVN